MMRRKKTESSGRRKRRVCGEEERGQDGKEDDSKTKLLFSLSSPFHYLSQNITVQELNHFWFRLNEISFLFLFGM
jgi:hypothetical protein